MWMREKTDNQPDLFGSGNQPETETILLCALGEFQARGKILADRPLALDRLRGAFKRAAEKYQSAEIADEAIAQTLEKLGAKVVRRPSFVAKHPYQITVSQELAKKAQEIYKNDLAREEVKT